MSFLAQRTPHLHDLHASRANPYDPGHGQLLDYHYTTPASNYYPPEQYHFAGEWSETDYISAGGYMDFDSSASSPESIKSLDTPPATPSYESGNASTSPQKRASRRGPDHIPRPRNAFMIFRSELCASGKITKKVEGDHRHISITAAAVWRAFTEEEKKPYLLQAELEKLEHRRLYPNYRFTPTVRTKKPVKRKVHRNGPEDVERSRKVAKLILAGKQGHALEEAVKNFDEGAAPAMTEFIASQPPPPSAPSPERRDPVVRGWVSHTGQSETVVLSEPHPPRDVSSPVAGPQILMPLAVEQYAPNYSRSLPANFDAQRYTGKPRSSNLPAHCSGPPSNVLFELYENVVDRPFS
ncbi:hypothetical protein B0H19DRAFT_1136171 [Mycena capillaripes]|nr:hypothetical protein B0H19DRAFT_1136171 [Mycena capillaripes]